LANLAAPYLRPTYYGEALSREELDFVGQYAERPRGGWRQPGEIAALQPLELEESARTRRSAPNHQWGGVPRRFQTQDVLQEASRPSAIGACDR
jgi:hypothetical protein